MKGFRVIANAAEVYTTFNFGPTAIRHTLEVAVLGSNRSQEVAQPILGNSAKRLRILFAWPHPGLELQAAGRAKHTHHAFVITHMNTITQCPVFWLNGRRNRLGRVGETFRTNYSSQSNTPGADPSGWFAGMQSVRPNLTIDDASLSEHGFPAGHLNPAPGRRWQRYRNASGHGKSDEDPSNQLLPELSAIRTRRIEPNYS